jgi:NAD(P)-dependent dehydrogenase (short-subunit alcohol dehydrogenase family)
MERKKGYVRLVAPQPPAAQRGVFFTHVSFRGAAPTIGRRSDMLPKTERQEKRMNVAQKTILITGANRGVGRALVAEALRRNAKRIFAGTRGTLAQADARVTAVTLDVTKGAHIEQAARDVESLDILINCAGVAGYDDLTDPEVIQRHLDVNFLGPFKVTQAFLPALKRSKGAVVNVLSLAALAPLPIIPSYSISKAAALSMTQSLRAYLGPKGVAVHAVFLGPVDTDMTRGFDIPKASPESAARGIFDGLERGDEDIFPDPASQNVTEGWRGGVVKAMERQNAVFIPGGMR